MMGLVQCFKGVVIITTLVHIWCWYFGHVMYVIWSACDVTGLCFLACLILHKQFDLVS